MSKKAEVTHYVQTVFERYGLDENEFFYEYDPDKNEHYNIPLFRGKSIDEYTLTRISRATGLTKNEILNQDESAATRYWEKYRFFELYHKYKAEWFYQAHYAHVTNPEELVIKAIFGDKANVDVSKRYNRSLVEHRMIDQLKEIDKVMPGTYHSDAKITQLHIETEVFVSFPECETMISSLLDMLDNVQKLFFKGIRENLTSEEIQEYNFLISWLRITDIVMPSVTLTYNNLCLYREAYAAEKYKDFVSYVRIRSFIGTSPWRCKEFFDDMNLVKRFVEYFPESKYRMREFSTEVSKFSCYFVWSDAKPISYSPEEERELDEFCEAVGEERLPPEKRAKEVTHIYVNKISAEMFDWEPYAIRLAKATASRGKGGISVTIELSNITENSIARILRRSEARLRGN